MARQIQRSHVAKEPLCFDPTRTYGDCCAGRLLEQKPVGFWYEINGSWRTWLREIREPHDSRYVYDVQIDEAQVRLLCLRTVAQLKAFQAQFGRSIGTTHLSYVCWGDVYEAYDGIECSPYFVGQRQNWRWYAGLDVASGCLWNLAHVTITPSEE
jgi:hypothetical protein